MFSVFTEDLLQKQFEEKGYVLISSLINKEEIEALNHLFEKFKNQYDGSFHTSHFSADVNYKQQVHDTLAALVFPKVSPYLNNFLPVFGNFMIKNPGPERFMPLHADWTYVDEERFSSVAIWVPLVDVNTKNGCLGIIEGSHTITNAIRGPLIQQSTSLNDREWVKRFGKLIPMKAGDAIIYNHALMHYSPPNKTKVPRPAFNLSAVPGGVPLVHYCKPEGAKGIEVYGVNDNSFYIRYNSFQRPETGTLIDTLPDDVIVLIDERMKDYNRPTNVFDKVKNWFKV